MRSPPARARGRGSRNAAEALTKDLCQRWLEGERAALWAQTADQRGAAKAPRAAQRAQRCAELAADALCSESCAALASQPPVEVTADALEQMRQKHPRSQRPVDAASLPAAHAAAAPRLSADAVEREVRALPRGPLQTPPACVRVA